MHLTGAGTVTLRATQNGNVDLAHPETVKDSYAGAVPVDRSFLVSKGTPVFSALDTPTAEAGASAPSVSGTLALGGLVPTGSVAVTLNAVTVNAAVGADGRFTATFPASTFGVAASPYAIAFVYDGDANFTAATGASTLTVVDTTAPFVGTMSANPNLVTLPNHKMFHVFADYSASDVSGAPVCALAVTSNEPINGTGDGDTAPDWLILDAHHLQLRAERAGSGSGRVYTITATCTDAFGNATAAATTVAVPK